MPTPTTASRRFYRRVRLTILSVILGPFIFAAEAPPAQETILFLGDSITAAGGYIRKIEAVVKKDNPSHAPRFIGRGRPSETVSGLSEAYHPGVRPYLFDRLNEELVKAKPDWVVACYGMNDGIYHPFDEKRFAAYQAGIAKLIQRVQAAGCRLILITPPHYAKAAPAFPEGSDKAAQERLIEKANQHACEAAAGNPRLYGYRTPYVYYDHVLDVYASWLLSLNDGKGIWVINLRDAMASRLKECYGADPIHPNPTGHELMADIILAQWPRIMQEGQRAVVTSLPAAQRR